MIWHLTRNRATTTTRKTTCHRTYLLPSGIPNIELDRSTIGVEQQWVDFDPKSSHILLFELSRQVSLDKSSLTDTTIPHKDKLEFWNFWLRLSLHCFVLVKQECAQECEKRIDTTTANPHTTMTLVLGRSRWKWLVALMGRLGEFLFYG